MSYRKNNVFYILATLCLFACVENFEPNLQEYEDLIVIDGSIIQNDSLQKIIITHSTSVMDPTYKPISGCLVRVQDKEGNDFIFEESDSGVYSTSIPKVFLETNAAFQLYVKTPSAIEYLSDFESIQSSSDIDSIYFLDEPFQSSEGNAEDGLQLYTDLKAPDSATKNYQWSVEETWEIQTFYQIDGSWKDEMTRIPEFDPKHGKNSQCWSTRTIKSRFTSSTDKLLVNEKKMIPLSFIPGTSPKLNTRYSVLVKQYSLSDEAYNYHHQNNMASSGNAGLFSSQPAQTKSNIRNINNPDEIVLGFFWVSSYSEKRIFFPGPLTILNDNHCDYLVHCIPKEGQSLFEYFKALGRDVLLVALEFSSIKPDSVILWAFPRNQVCIDCTTDGGSPIKPAFWE